MPKDEDGRSEGKRRCFDFISRFKLGQKLLRRHQDTHFQSPTEALWESHHLHHVPAIPHPNFLSRVSSILSFKATRSRKVPLCPALPVDPRLVQFG